MRILGAVMREAKGTVDTLHGAYVRELVLLLGGAAWLFVLLALCSYHYTDLSTWYYATQPPAVHNWCGLWGAACAAWLVYFFGAAGLCLLAWIALCGAAWWQRTCAAQVVRLGAAWGLWLTVVLWCAWVQQGGLVGNLVLQALYRVAGPLGSIVLLSSASLLCAAVMLQQRMLLVVQQALACVWLGVVRSFVYSFGFVRCAASLVYYVLDAASAGFVFVMRGAPQESGTVASPVTMQPAVSDLLQEPLVSSVQRVRNTVVVRRLLGVKVPRLPTTCLSLFVFIDGGKSWRSLVAAVSNKPVARKRVLPDVQLFGVADHADDLALQEAAQQGAQALEHKLLQCGIRGKVTAVKPGPLITLYEYAPDADTKVSKIVALEDDLALALRARSIRIIAPVPGTSVVGFEIAGAHRAPVHAHTLFGGPAFAQARATMRLPLALGVDVAGAPAIYDLATMPHLLVGGSTGSGKSVGLHSMLTSLLCAGGPEQIRLILIDPKRLEFTAYQDLPHLVVPVVTSPTQASSVLKWVVCEMEQRYERMAKAGVRNIDQYQQHVDEPMASLVVVIDELADLMMVAGKEIEAYVVRIAQMARAAGIHMILATQRPSVDVVTGLIKVNFPSRIAFKVSSKIDSRTIIDVPGAERLLGKGDMLFLHNSGHIHRLHGAYVTEEHVQEVCDFWRAKAQPDYLDVQEALGTIGGGALASFDDQDTALYQEVLAFVRQSDQVSISLLQRRFRIGFNKSARMIERLEQDGLISPAHAGKVRKVLR